MLLDSEESVFDLKLNADGARAIQSIARIATIIFIISIPLMCLVVGSEIIRILYYQTFETRGNITSIIELRIFPVISIIILLLNFYQLIVYVRFAKKCNLSVRDRDQDSFNRSFTIMRRSLII